MKTIIVTLGLAGLLLYACSNYNTGPCDAGATSSPTQDQNVTEQEDQGDPSTGSPTDLASTTDAASPPCVGDCDDVQCDKDDHGECDADDGQDDDVDCSCALVGHGEGNGHCKDKHRIHSQGHGNGHCKYDC